MPQNTNVNNNAAVVVVGRTAPVPTGQQSADKSIPVVVASDQEAIPVEEQNKQQSEVALSLLGIPRSEVALGIFADVNTYDVNPSEWSATPEQTTTILATERVDFAGIGGEQDWGLSHVPAEAGALIEAPPTESAVLTSKRFFRYQPGRVSAGTFGVKFGPSPYTTLPIGSTFPTGTNGVDYQLDALDFQVRHPTIKKYGVFDNFDGYYYESINESIRDNFCCVRRTQSLIQQKSQYFFYNPDLTADNPRQYGTKQYEDYGNMELPGQYYKYHGDAVILRDGLVNIHAGLFDPSLLKKKRTIGIDSIDGDPSNWIELDTVEQTITNFTYNNETGRATVTTAGDHGYKNGDSITLKDILLECNTGQKLYPNKYSRKFFQVESISGNDYTIHVGISDKDGQTLSSGITFTNTSVTGGTIREMTSSSNGPDLTITAIDRTSVTQLREVGLLEITVSGNHDLKEGDHVQWTTGATWSGQSANGGVYPNISATTAGRTQQKYFQVRYVKNSQTFTIQIGDPAFSELDVNAEWTSGGAFQKVNSFTKNSPTNISTVSYVASTGKMTINAGGAIAGLAVGDFVELADIKTECTYGDKVYPAKDDEETFPIINVTSNTFQFELFTSTIVHTHRAAGVTGRTSNLGLRKGSGVYYYKNGQTTDAVDGGIYYVRDVLGKRIKLSEVPDNGLSSDAESGVFSSSKIGDVAISNAAQQYKLTPTTSSTYDPATGLFQFNFATAHGLVTGDKIRIDDFSIGIDCSTPYATGLTVTAGQFVVNNGLVYEAVNGGTTADATGPVHTSGDVALDGITWRFQTDEPIKYYPRPYNASPAAGLPNKDPAAGKFLTVTLVDANNFTVQVLPQTPSSDQNASNIVYVSPFSITVEKSRPYIITPAPFILPDTESNKYQGTYQADDKNIVQSGVPFGCFPYKYIEGADSYGYINTDVVGNTIAGSTSLRSEIDFVNNKLLKDWVYNHVDPQYWTVYEYRVPRSRFSGEKVDAQEDREVKYSDVVYAAGSQKFPGQNVIDPATEGTLTRTSNWNLNPENVTMYKIEFSWYGAVGALFLAYVPLDNGEARWVRVHHLRASNQLKVSSLGNPTLPITYLVYGGGTEKSYGYINSRKVENYIANSNSYSEFLVKYGASYYIDGGDRGTVRLFNYATPTQENVYGNKLRYSLNATNNQFGAGNNAGGDPLPHLILTGAGATRPVANNDLTITADNYTIFMGATVVTPNREPNVKVVWVDGANGKIYLSKPISTSQASTTFDIILDRPKLLMGLKCREEVNSVRNRIQVYPTRLSIGNSGSFATIKLIKSPKFQTKDVTTGNFTTSYTVGEALNLGSIGKPVQLDSTKINSNSVGFLDELGSTFGYFRGFFEGTSSIVTVFGKLSRDASGIYSFAADEKTNTKLLIYGDFLKAGEYKEPNPSPNGLDGSNVTPTDTPLAALSAIAINSEQRTPIPGTGQQITTIYTPSNSGEQFELQQFFDYNKDYLSFPLTNEIETLYIAASENSLYDSTTAATSLTAALTWEEQ